MDEYMSWRLSKKLQRIYEHAEMLKLLTWDLIECEQDELEWSGEITPEERFLDAEAACNGKVLQIVVNDVLPRKKDVNPAFKSAVPLRNYWVGNIVNAVKRLGVNIHFHNALCVIKVYAPSAKKWDVDNRALSMIPNALRFANIISGDTWDKMALLLMGGIDRKRPRTEITVMEFPENLLKEIPTLIAKNGN